MRRFVLITLLAALVAACASPAGKDEARLTQVAYSTPREAYAELIHAFQTTPEGAGVSFDESYGGSTEQSRAIQEGLPADVVALSLEPDLTVLVKSGLVDAGWNRDALTLGIAVLAVAAKTFEVLKTHG